MRKAILAVALFGTLAAGCSGPTTVSGVIDSAYTPELINYAAGSGGMPVTVVGNPFPVPKAELDKIITSTMEVSYFGQRMPFFTERPPEFRSPYYIVLIFNPQLGVNNQALCVNPNQPTAVEPGRLRMMGVLCSSDRRLTSTTGGVAALDDPSAPAFRQLIAQMTYELLPPYTERNDRRVRAPFVGPIGFR
ncbi:MAG: hypothetical protein AAF495_27835 [Pseudomonadota bacterium]